MPPCILHCCHIKSVTEVYAAVYIILLSYEECHWGVCRPVYYIVVIWRVSLRCMPPCILHCCHMKSVIEVYAALYITLLPYEECHWGVCRPVYYIVVIWRVSLRCMPPCILHCCHMKSVIEVYAALYITLLPYEECHWGVYRPVYYIVAIWRVSLWCMPPCILHCCYMKSVIEVYAALYITLLSYEECHWGVCRPVYYIVAIWRVSLRCMPPCILHCCHMKSVIVVYAALYITLLPYEECHWGLCRPVYYIVVIWRVSLRLMPPCKLNCCHMKSVIEVYATLYITLLSYEECHWGVYRPVNWIVIIWRVSLRCMPPCILHCCHMTSVIEVYAALYITLLSYEECHWGVCRPVYYIVVTWRVSLRCMPPCIIHCCHMKSVIVVYAALYITLLPYEECHWGVCSPVYYIVGIWKVSRILFIWQ